MITTTCIVGGWTEAQGSRPFFAALLLGVRDPEGQLHYVGQVGAGFSDAELGRVWKRLHALRSRTCPFAAEPRTGRRAHWVKPRLAINVTHAGWTKGGKLKHATFAEMAREDEAAPPRERRAKSAAATVAVPVLLDRAADRVAKAAITKASAAKSVAKVLAQIDAIADRGGNGVLEFGGGQRLEVTNLGKVFWPALGLTKGDLMRHYARVSPYLLPVLADRPLVMKRYPNGVAAKPFYQHRAPDSVPPGVHTAIVTTDNETRAHVVGGDLLTLLYTAQLASISQDPWFSRVGSERFIDHMAIDLDPPDGLAYDRVLDVARWVRDELAALKAPGFPKTSGAGGLHIYVPLPRRTPYEAGMLLGQIIATRVAQKHPKLATVERSIAARGQRIYVDYMQNALGKTLASAYSPRANDFAGVSAPLTWDEVDAGVRPTDFTIATFAARLADVGDLWAGIRKAKAPDLAALTRASA